ncbi:inositol monophosphatase family protein [Rhizobium sp. BK377]|uniref:inositol monophosphatase family protein n=1 Tax=Rhizobium sp. BK377 TaxID=2587058 RepID=UPI003917E78B
MSPCSACSRYSQRRAFGLISEEFPDHSIVGEEYGVTGAGACQWVLDPIDGTRPFLLGIPVWGTLIGFCEQGRATDGRLVKVLPHYRLHAHGLHAVFPSRRGLVPAVRAFLDFLAEELPGMLAAVTGGYDDGYRPGSLGSNRTS